MNQRVKTDEPSSAVPSLAPAEDHLAPGLPLAGDAEQSQLHAGSHALSDYELACGEDGVDQSWYLQVNPDVAAAGVDPVTHYLVHGWLEGRDPRRDFSTSGYLRANEEAARAQCSPLIHFLRHGGTKVLPGEPAPTDWYLLWKKGFLYPKIGQDPPQPNGPYGTKGRLKILFTGHEASRTGAPLLLLRLMEAFESLTGCETFLVLERDGPLLEQYTRVAHVLVNRKGMLYEPEGPSLRRLLKSIAKPGPELAICNCADTWRLTQALREVDLPQIVSLIHEQVIHYSHEIWQIIHRSSDRVILSAEAVKAATMRAVPLFQDAEVVSQGLLNPEFGLGNKRAARSEVRDALGISADTKIVLGCGSRNMRKGTDLFVQLAARVRSQSTKAVHFVWLGAGDDTEFSKFIQHDLALLDLCSTVSLLGDTADPERYFLAADAFSLTSRDDPFPCVIHEAMACALPIVVFDGAGGAKEAISEGCGIVVPYLDIEAMARTITSILETPSKFAEMGGNAGRRVRSVYRFSNYAKRILDICAALPKRVKWSSGTPD